jgi:hypothetical protein
MRNVLGLLLALSLMLGAGCTPGKSGREGFKELAYSVTGGIAGFDQQLAIGSEGSFQTAEKGKPGKSGSLTAAELKTLRDLVGKVQWAAVAERYVDPKVADALMQTVTVNVGGKQYQTTVGTGGQAPAALMELLGPLQRIYAEHR